MPMFTYYCRTCGTQYQYNSFRRPGRPPRYCNSVCNQTMMNRIRGTNEDIEVHCNSCGRTFMCTSENRTNSICTTCANTPRPGVYASPDDKLQGHATMQGKAQQAKHQDIWDDDTGWWRPDSLMMPPPESESRPWYVRTPERFKDCMIPAPRRNIIKKAIDKCESRFWTENPEAKTCLLDFIYILTWGVAAWGNVYNMPLHMDDLSDERDAAIEPYRSILLKLWGETLYRQLPPDPDPRKFTIQIEGYLTSMTAEYNRIDKKMRKNGPKVTERETELWSWLPQGKSALVGFQMLLQSNDSSPWEVWTHDFYQACAPLPRKPRTQRIGPTGDLYLDKPHRSLVRALYNFPIGTLQTLVGDKISISDLVTIDTLDTLDQEMQYRCATMVHGKDYTKGQR